MIRRIAHVGLAVPSIQEARKFWEACGLVVERIEEVPSEGVRVAFIPCGESSIELLEPLGSDSPVERFLASRGPGVHHICLESTDLSADEERLRDAGVRLLREQPAVGAGGARVQFVHPKSANGVLLELTDGGAHP